MFDRILKHLIPRRRFTIAFDGNFNSGKSTLARYIAWKAGIPLIETDLFLIPDSGLKQYRYASMIKLIESRHQLDRPLLIEGVRILHSLNKVGIKPDLLIFCENTNNHACDRYQDLIAPYDKKYCPRSVADYIYTWAERWD